MGKYMVPHLLFCVVNVPVLSNIWPDADKANAQIKEYPPLKRETPTGAIML